MTSDFLKAIENKFGDYFKNNLENIKSNLNKINHIYGQVGWGFDNIEGGIDSVVSQINRVVKIVDVAQKELQYAHNKIQSLEESVSDPELRNSLFDDYIKNKLPNLYEVVFNDISGRLPVPSMKVEPANISPITEWVTTPHR